MATTQEFSYKINEDSKYIDNYKQLFELFGIAMGKALFDNVPLNLCLCKSIFKAILGQTKEEDYMDLEEF